MEETRNLDFSIISIAPMMDDSCYYCGMPIREKHIQISFESKRKILLHIDHCWELFVLGVNTIDERLETVLVN